MIRVLAVLLFLTAYAVFVRVTGLGIPCLFHLVTGLNCPGCGGTRMFTALLRLDFSGAFRENMGLFILMPLILPLIGILLYRYLYHRKAGKAAETALSVYAGVLCGLLLAWAIVRNILRL